MALTEKREAERDRKKEIPMNAAFNFSIQGPLGGTINFISNTHSTAFLIAVVAAAATKEFYFTVRGSQHLSDLTMKDMSCM